MASPVAHSRKLETLDDRELARLATAGDGHAFAELYDRHERRVYGFCMRMLGTPHDAADATQETFVRMLGRLPSLEGRELNFAAYALTAARNACYDMIEGRRRIEPVAEQSDGSRVGHYSPPDDNLERDPERAALLAATREDVRAANAELPARQREVLALREVELLSYDEIGELMGLNRNAVAQLVSRARIKLRDLLRGSALASVSASSSHCAKSATAAGKHPGRRTLRPRRARLGTRAPRRMRHLPAQLRPRCRRLASPTARSPRSYRCSGCATRRSPAPPNSCGADWSHIATRSRLGAHGPSRRAGTQTWTVLRHASADRRSNRGASTRDSQQTDALPGNAVRSNRAWLARWSARRRRPARAMPTPRSDGLASRGTATSHARPRRPGISPCTALTTATLPAAPSPPPGRSRSPGSKLDANARSPQLHSPTSDGSPRDYYPGKTTPSDDSRAQQPSSPPETAKPIGRHPR